MNRLWWWVIIQVVTSCIDGLISGKRLMNLTYVDRSNCRVGTLHKWNLECNNWNWTIGLQKIPKHSNKCSITYYSYWHEVYVIEYKGCILLVSISISWSILYTPRCPLFKKLYFSILQFIFNPSIFLGPGFVMIDLTFIAFTDLDLGSPAMRLPNSPRMYPPTFTMFSWQAGAWSAWEQKQQIYNTCIYTANSHWGLIFQITT